MKINPSAGGTDDNTAVASPQNTKSSDFALGQQILNDKYDRLIETMQNILERVRERPVGRPCIQRDEPEAPIQNDEKPTPEQGQLDIENQMKEGDNLKGDNLNAAVDPIKAEDPKEVKKEKKEKEEKEENSEVPIAEMIRLNSEELSGQQVSQPNSSGEDTTSTDDESSADKEVKKPESPTTNLQEEEKIPSGEDIDERMDSPPDKGSSSDEDSSSNTATKSEGAKPLDGANPSEQAKPLGETKPTDSTSDTAVPSIEDTIPRVDTEPFVGNPLNKASDEEKKNGENPVENEPNTAGKNDQLSIFPKVPNVQHDPTTKHIEDNNHHNPDESIQDYLEELKNKEQQLQNMNRKLEQSESKWNRAIEYIQFLLKKIFGVDFICMHSNCEPSGDGLVLDGESDVNGIPALFYDDASSRREKNPISNGHINTHKTGEKEHNHPIPDVGELLRTINNHQSPKNDRNLDVLTAEIEREPHGRTSKNENNTPFDGKDELTIAAEAEEILRVINNPKLSKPEAPEAERVIHKGKKIEPKENIYGLDAEVDDLLPLTHPHKSTKTPSDEKDEPAIAAEAENVFRDIKKPKTLRTEEPEAVRLIHPERTTEPKENIHSLDTDDIPPQTYHHKSPGTHSKLDDSNNEDSPQETLPYRLPKPHNDLGDEAPPQTLHQNKPSMTHRNEDDLASYE